MSVLPSFRNRIVEQRVVTAAELRTNPLNWRKHPQAQAAALRGVLAEVGIAAPLTAYYSEAAGGALTLIDGHLRLSTGSAWPTDILDVSDAEANLLLASFDPLAAMAQADGAALDALLRDVQMGDAALQAMLDKLAQDAGIAPDTRIVDAEPQIDRADELRQKWGVESGQLWQLGDHRLICGDCTDAGVVARVMDGNVPVLMVTDPPYGVEYDTAWREDAGISTMGAQSAKGLEWDTNDEWAGAYRLGGAQVAFVWCADAHSIVVAQSLVSAGYEIKQMIIWNKSVAPFGRSHYSFKHETCWYAVAKGKSANWHGPNNEVTVWDGASPRHIMGGSEEEKTPHPTQKPVMIYTRPITNHTRAGDAVYEPFSGSGTAIIACESLSRRCRAVEISPAYVAVALQRYADATGKTPELVGEPALVAA